MILIIPSEGAARVEKALGSLTSPGGDDDLVHDGDEAADTNSKYLLNFLKLSPFVPFY
jgi:hypothetical protein